MDRATSHNLAARRAARPTRRRTRNTSNKPRPARPKPPQDNLGGFNHLTNGDHNLADTLSLVHDLTRTHKTTVEHDDGTRTYVDELSLLEQLRDAFTGKGSGNGGNQTSAPISTNAFDLWQEIAETTLKYWPGYGRPHLARTPLPGRIQQWAAVAINSNDPEDEKTLHKYATRWIREIQSLFEPSIDLAAPCPECHESYIWRHESGENIRKRCLTFNKHRAQCINCKTTWEGKASMANLARIINHDQPLNGSPAHTTQTGA